MVNRNRRGGALGQPSPRPAYPPGSGASAAPRQRRRPSLFLALWAPIVVGVVLAVVNPAILGSWDTVRTAACARVELPHCPLVLPDEVLGRWAFVRFEPAAPPSQFGMTTVPTTMAIFEGGKYTADIVQSMDGGPEASLRYSGAYTVKGKGDGWARVEFKSTTENKLLGVSRLELGGGTLRITDEGSNLTMVFQRT